jgi:hypothetical protein
MFEENDGRGDEAARRMVIQQEWLDLTDLVVKQRVCEATGEPLDARNTVAMTVSVSRGVSRLALVSAAHWDSGQGELTSADPAVDPDVLDGRKLAPHVGSAEWASGSPRSRRRSVPGAGPVQQPRPQLPGSPGAVPGVR